MNIATLRHAMLLLPLLACAGCGSQISQLNKLAAQGSVDESAPVKASAQIVIAAPPGRVWALLVDAASWPAWNKDIQKVSCQGQLRTGTQFSWQTGGWTIHSQVQLLEEERRLGWTGTAFIATAIHQWELAARPDGQTLVAVRESLEGPWVASIVSSEDIAASDSAWLQALKRAAESQKTR